MRYLKKRLLVVALILITIMTGVLFYEAPTVQTGASADRDAGSWHIGNGKQQITGASGSPKGETGRGISVVENDGRSPDEMAEGSPTASQPPSLGEAGGATADLGAGCVTDITVRPGYRYYAAAELSKGLLYDLKPLAPLFIQAQNKYGIDAVFLAAVSAEESGWGRYQFRDNNIFGFENCDYDSLEACVDHAASWLHTEYLTPGGRYYEGVGVADVNVHYNGRDTWEEHITAIMHQIVNRIESED